MNIRIIILNCEFHIKTYKPRTCIYRVGIGKTDITKLIYAKATQSINYAIRMFVNGLFLVPIMHLSPFIVALYHLCMRSYTIDLWTYYYPIW